jgi:molecular chaperone HscB
MDPFAVLGVPREFALNEAELEKKHRELSKALHPDRYVAAAPSERREALSRAVEVNEAYRVLKDDVRRAEALFGLAGIAVGEAVEPKASALFLMEVLEDREALAAAKAARHGAQVQKLASAMEARQRETKAALGLAFRTGTQESLRSALPKLGELRFFRRFLDEVRAIEDELDGLEHPSL